MKAKIRIQIPQDIAAKVLFHSDRTCCVCNIPGKSIQIHHIDGNPSNNIVDNLSVLCLECHNETMIKGGFGRKLDSNQVIIYRDSWIERVKKRKDNADEIASIKSVTGISHNSNDLDFDDSLNYKTNNDKTVLQNYLDKIVIVHKEQFMIAETKWKSDVTIGMNQGNANLIDFYEEVLVELSTFYPIGHFNKQHPKIYFNQLISERFIWNRLILEPEGIGFDGTIISLVTAGNVMADLREAIVQMVKSLLFAYDLNGTIDIGKWVIDWLEEANAMGNRHYTSF